MHPSRHDGFKLQRFELFQRHRAAEQVSLKHVAAVGHQQRTMCLRLDALCNYLQAEPSAAPAKRKEDRCVSKKA